MAKIQFEKIIERFGDNGVYTLRDSTKCTEYIMYARKNTDISDLLFECSFSDDYEYHKAPGITLHDRTMLLLIAKLGVVNFKDLRAAMAMRQKKEKKTYLYSTNNNSEFKEYLDKRLVNKGLAIRCRIVQSTIDPETQKENIWKEHIYCITNKGVWLVNKSMDKYFKDIDALRIIDDINIRDKLGRMAMAHIALRFSENGYTILQSRYSKMNNVVERFPMLLYNKEKNCEVMMQYLYFQRNPELETIEEFSEKIWNIVNDVFRWVSSEGFFEKDKVPAKRRVVLCCNNLSDYDKFLSCLIQNFSRTEYFNFVEHVYATSVGFVDAGVGLNDCMYHHRSIQEINGITQPVDDEVEFND